MSRPRDITSSRTLLSRLREAGNATKPSNTDSARIQRWLAGTQTSADNSRREATTMRRIEFPSLDVSVRADGHTLQEYADDTEDMGADNLTSKYVEAPTGENFYIHVHYGPGFPYGTGDIEVRVKLDGKWATSTLHEAKAKHEAKSYNIKGINSFRHGIPILERFKFAELSTGM